MTNSEVARYDFSKKIIVKFAKAITLVVCIAQDS